MSFIQEKVSASRKMQKLYFNSVRRSENTLIYSLTFSTIYSANRIFLIILSANNIPVLHASLSHNIGFRYKSLAQAVTIQ